LFQAASALSGFRTVSTNAATSALRIEFMAAF
jgi:hypothetical protein